MEDAFQDKCVLVTGAGVGIGYALCEAFARHGANVGLNDIDGDLAKQAAAIINGDIGTSRVTAYGTDVADVVALRSMIDEFADQYGRLDVVIANAGITSFGQFLEYSVADFDRVVAVNVRGSYFTAQAAARKMIEFGTVDGRILLMSSVTGVRALKNLGAYGVTKAGISHMASTIAVELGPHRITVNAICPGATLTERNLAEDPDYEVNWGLVTPTGRVGYTNDIVATSLFLASGSARQITGQTIVVDGGWTLPSPLPPDSAQFTSDHQ